MKKLLFITLLFLSVLAGYNYGEYREHIKLEQKLKMCLPR